MRDLMDTENREDYDYRARLSFATKENEHTSGMEHKIILLVGLSILDTLSSPSFDDKDGTVLKTLKEYQDIIIACFNSIQNDMEEISGHDVFVEKNHSCLFPEKIDGYQYKVTTLAYSREIDVIGVKSKPILEYMKENDIHVDHDQADFL